MHQIVQVYYYLYTEGVYRVVGLYKIRLILLLHFIHFHL